MPGIDGFETSQRLLDSIPGTTVVLVYTSAEPSVDELTRSGAATALQTEALTPASLRALWEEQKPR
jgi:CheY-like chemotaxis protein